MASITIVDKPLPKKISKNIWAITLKYKLHFEDVDINMGKLLGVKFWDGARLMESDDGEIFGGDDDVLSSWVSPEGLFVPTQHDVERSVTFNISESTLDTEWGEERLYSRIRLRNVGLNLPPIFKRSHILPLDI